MGLDSCHWQNDFVFFSFHCRPSLHIPTALAYLYIVSLSRVYKSRGPAFSLLPSLSFSSTILQLTAASSSSLIAADSRSSCTSRLNPHFTFKTHRVLSIFQDYGRIATGTVPLTVLVFGL